MKNKVHQSFEAPGGSVCVDVFQRPDNSWGIEEYRRDAEDGRGWYVTGFLAETRYKDRESALTAARSLVPWFGPGDASAAQSLQKTTSNQHIKRS